MVEGKLLHFTHFMETYRPKMTAMLHTHIDTLCDTSISTHSLWHTKLRDMLHSYVVAGKMLRGLLVPYWFFLYGGTGSSTWIWDVAITLEILQSFLLIHDDIMDEDLLRRGMPSFHVMFSQYFSDAISIKNTRVFNDNKTTILADNLGESLAISTGDILFSYTIRIFAEKMPSTILPTALTYYSSYVSKVGIAQMNDVLWGYSDNIPSSEEILGMYIGKTGHYTFSLPAVLGYLASRLHAPSSYKEIDMLDTLGGLCGIIFQIKDDIIGSKHPSDKTGKPQGSDFIKGKKTYVYSLIKEYAIKSSQEIRFNTLFTPPIPEQSVPDILQFIDDLGIWDILDRKIHVFTQDIHAILSKLSLDDTAKSSLRELITYLITREQ